MDFPKLFITALLVLAQASFSSFKGIYASKLRNICLQAHHMMHSEITPKGFLVDSRCADSCGSSSKQKKATNIMILVVQIENRLSLSLPSSYRTHKLAPRCQFFWLPRTDYTHKVRRNPISARQQTRQIQSVS